MQNPEPNTANTPQGPASAMPADATIPQGHNDRGASQAHDATSAQQAQPAMPGSGGQTGVRPEAGGTPPQGSAGQSNPDDAMPSDSPPVGPDGSAGVSLTGNDASATGSREQQANPDAAIASQQSGGAQSQQAPLGERNPDNWEAQHGADHTRTGSQP